MLDIDFLSMSRLLPKIIQGRYEKKILTWESQKQLVSSRSRSWLLYEERILQCQRSRRHLSPIVHNSSSFRRQPRKSRNLLENLNILSKINKSEISMNIISKYVYMIGKPAIMNSIQLITLFPLKNSAFECMYHVAYQVKPVQLIVI